MPAVAILKTMPKSCFDCPFFDSAAFDYEICCSVLNYNKTKYRTDYNVDYQKNRLKECPLWHLPKGYALVQEKADRLRV